MKISTSHSGRQSVGATAPLHDLTSHNEPFLTPDRLADYFGVSRRYIRKEIEAGHLKAVRFGPRSLRVPTEEAINFERRSTFQPDAHPCDRNAAPPSRRRGDDDR